MSGISTHALDVSRGCPAAGIAVSLQYDVAGQWMNLGDGITDQDGRCCELLGATALATGAYRLIFSTAAYFDAHRIAGLYPEVTITFLVRDATQHHHIPLLLAANSYTTYRGS